jgi:hypothetical protein
VGTALGFALVILDLWVGYSQIETLHHPVLAQIWIITREFLYTVLIVRVLAFGLICARRLSGVARKRLHVDLLDLSPLEPFTRHGMRLALYWLLLWSIWVPVFWTPSLDERAFVAMAVLIGLQVLLAVAAIAIPTQGARERVREAKRAALAEVRAAIGLDRIAVIDPEIQNPPAPRRACPRCSRGRRVSLRCPNPSSTPRYCAGWVSTC